PAAEPRRRVLALLEQGYGIEQLSERLGLAERVFTDLRDEVTRTVSPATAETIASASVTVLGAPLWRVDARLSHDRARSLRRRGHTSRSIAAAVWPAAGPDTGYNFDRVHVSAATAAKVRAVYRRLS